MGMAPANGREQVREGSEGPETRGREWYDMGRGGRRKGEHAGEKYGRE